MQNGLDDTVGASAEAIEQGRRLSEWAWEPENGKSTKARSGPCAERIGAGISSGPCGAVTLAGVPAALARWTSPALGINATSTLVLLSTEGALA